MITVYFKDYSSKTNGALQPAQAVINMRVLSESDVIPAGVLWVDLENPTAEEELRLKLQLGVTIPTSEEIWKNHVLNRMYTEGGISYMSAAVISKVNTPYPETRAVTFIMSSNYLVTLRHVSPTSFKNFSQRIQSHPQYFSSGAAVLEGLLEEIITRVAHNSELVVDQLDNLSHRIFDTQVAEDSSKNPSLVMKDVLRRLGGCADLNSKINESLHSISRLLSYFKGMQKDNKQLEEEIDILIKDVASLTKQTAFLADKITFQMDATLGMINVQQNMIIKIFSVVTVFFLPPTLVSSIYGMNFANMPELAWPQGYPMALLLMLLFALTPFWYFRRKKWL